MAKQDEVLSREVVIAAKLEENGIALRAKSRAVSALDRLVGSLFDMPAAFFEGVSRKKRLQDEINERLKNAQVRIAERQIEGMPELGAALIDDVLKDRARKQINTASVAIEAIDAMKALSPPEPSPDTETEPPQGNIDDDWMNQFVRFAEDASSERLQQVWGRVLAGEIHKPGSFSRHSLRFIAELDKETAENCEMIGRHVVGDWLLKDNDWNEGHEYLVTLDLQRLGIIEGVGFGGPQQNFTVNADGNAAIAGKSWGLLVRGTPGTKVSFEVFLLTRMGKEVMSLLNVADEVKNLRKVADIINKTGLDSIGLGQSYQLSDGRINFTSAVQPIWQATDQRQTTKN
jgi:hypothetical protein